MPQVDAILEGGSDHREQDVSDAAVSETPRNEEESQLATDVALEALLERARLELHADTAAILLLDESEQFLVATAARGIEEEVRQGVRVRAGRGFAGRIAAERRPVVLDRVSTDNVVNPLLLRRGIVSMLGVPLTADEHIIGVMHVGTLTPRKFVDADIVALEHAARRVAAAVLRHRAFVDRTAARALQASLIPRLPDIPGLQIAARYVPGSHYGVGGDWYDAFQLPDGRVGITIGDVMGHGLHAATMMGRVRSSLRSYALEHFNPATVLELLDRKLRHFEPGLLCTVCYLVLDPTDGAMSVSSAGHLPPALATAQGEAELLDLAVDPPVGIEPGLRRRSVDAEFPLGSLLCLYTDGMLQQRTVDIDDDLKRLCKSMQGLTAASAEYAVAEIMATMLGDRDPSDDVSLLVAARTGN